MGLNTNQLLCWIVGVCCGLSLLLMLQTTRRRWGWIVKLLVVLMVLVMGLFYFPASAGYVAGAVWALSVLIPSLGHRLVVQLCYRQDLAMAQHVARLLVWLHPFDDWKNLPAQLEAMVLSQRGEFDAAEALLRSHQDSATAFGRQAKLLLYRLQYRREKLREWVETELTPSDLIEDPALLLAYARNLGELGDIPALLETYATHKDVLERPAYRVWLNHFRQFVFAFTGDTTRTAQMLRGPFSMLPAQQRHFWQSVASWTGGDSEKARSIWRELSVEGDPSTRRAAERYLQLDTPPKRPQLTIEQQQLHEQIQQQWDHEVTYGGSIKPSGKRPVATYLLIAVNLVFFGVELLLGGSTKLDVLIRLGALDPQRVVLYAEWWRVIAATVLHYGSLHISFNMLALWVLGPWVEISLSVWRFLVVYMVAGVGAMAIHVLLTHLGWLPLQVVVGASGCIMGLVGATAAILWRGWKRTGSRIVRKRLGWIIMIICLQTSFDILTPEVSMVAHLLGLSLGFLTTWVLVNTVQ